MSGATFGTKGSIHVDSAYDYYFEGKADETEYVNPIKKIDKLVRTEKFLEKWLKDAFAQQPKLTKAIDSSSITVPTIIDSEITDRLRQETPVLELINRTTNRGKVASYDAHTERENGVFLGEGASMNDQDDTYTNETENMKYSYVVGGVTGQAKAADAHFIDAYAQTIRDKTVALRYLHEEKFFSGDKDTTPLEYDGLDNLITTNTSNKASASVLLDNVGVQLDACRTYGGKGKKMGVTDWGTLRDMKSQMMASVKYLDTQSIAWGLTAVQYEDMPIVPSRFTNQTSNSRRFYIVDNEVTEYRVLQEPTMEELGKTYDARRFFIKEYSVPIIKHEARCAMIYGIKWGGDW